jgi:hypothetical protein
MNSIFHVLQQIVKQKKKKITYFYTVPEFYKTWKGTVTLIIFENFMS